MEAEKTKKARRPRKQPKVHVEVVGSWKDRPAYERFQHWKPHIENMYHMLHNTGMTYLKGLGVKDSTLWNLSGGDRVDESSSNG